MCSADTASGLRRIRGIYSDQRERCSKTPGGPNWEETRVVGRAHGGDSIRASARDYLLVSNGVVGTKGFGNHKHNDLLSFEYHHSGVPLVVDPGSYVYTSDFDARNRFRSTASHNTLEVDWREQNDLKPEWIFRLFETSHAEHLAFEELPDYVEYRGRHHGYERF